VSDAAERQAVVVVGVDGSAGAGQALRWAVAEARLRGTPLRVVHAWESGYTGMAGGGPAFLGGTVDSVPSASLSDVHSIAEGVLERAIAEIVADAAGLVIERQVVEGPAAEVLIGAVRERDLLVVGSRGHGGVADLLLGSVSQKCAHEAPCPVVIVRTGISLAVPGTTAASESHA
jgi:nucleotide-binding universal stress UspA family protein